MADRFWVGGSGNINDAAAHWAAASGGAPGAGNLPTVADNAIWDANSGASPTITLNATFPCRDFDMGACAGTPTLTGNGQLSIAGNLTYKPGTVMTAAFGSVLLNANSPVVQQIRTNGVVITHQYNFQGTGTRQLADDLTFFGNLAFTLTGGIFDANGKTVTFNATNICQIVGAFTFFNLNVIAAASAAKLAGAAFSANIAVTGTLKYQGNSSINRLLLQSTVVGTPRTITAAAIDAASDNCDFMDIAGAGAAAPFAVGASLGDGPGNSGITFPPGLTLYAKSGVSFNWSDATKWFLGTNGTGGAGRVPLPQDDVVFDANSITAAGLSVSGDMPRLARNITWAGVINNPTFNNTVGTSGGFIFGSLTYAPTMTVLASSHMSLLGRGNHTITSAGKAHGQCVISSPGGTYTLLDAWVSTSRIQLNYGTFDANDFNVTTTAWGNFNGGNGVSLLKMGNGLWTLTGNDVSGGIGVVFGNSNNPTNGVIQAEGSTIKTTDTTANAKTISLNGGASLNNVWFSGISAGAFAITAAAGSNPTFNQFKIDAGNALRVTAGRTYTAADWQIGPGVNLDSLTAAAHTLAKSGGGVVHVYSASITNSTASPAATFIAHGSVDGGGNTAWSFPAARYWVGGSGNWSDTAHWSATSGGAGGAAMPAATDDAMFDRNAAPGAYTVTFDLAGAISCKDLAFASAPTGGGTITWAGSRSATLFGSLTLLAGMVNTYTGNLAFNATTVGNILRTNGVAVGGVSFNGVGGGWTLADALTCGNVGVTAGAVATAGFTWTCTDFQVSGAGVKSLTFGTSTLAFSGTLCDFSLGSGLTLSAAASTIDSTRNGGATVGTLPTQTFGTITKTNNTGGLTLNNLVCANLRMATTSAVQAATMFLGGAVTVTGLLTLTGPNAALARCLIASTTIGTPRALTAAAVALTNADWQDVAAAGAAAPFVGVSMGDALGNSGITFTPAVATTSAPAGTVSFNWSDATKWSGGRVPLPQDDVTVANAFSAGRAITMDMVRIGRNVTFTCTGVPLLSMAAQPTLFGNLEMPAAGATISAGGSWSFQGRGAHTIRSNGFSAWSPNINIQAPGGSYTLLDALTSGSLTGGTLTPLNGTFDDGGFNVTWAAFSSNVTTARTLRGSAVWSFGGTGLVWNAASAGMTLVAGPAWVVKLTDASAAVKEFRGGGLTYTNLWLSGAGTGAYQFTGSNTFKQFRTDAGRVLQFTAGTTTTATDWQIGDGAAISSITAAAHTLAKAGGGAVHVNGATIANSTASPAATFTAHGSTDGGGNTNWAFPPARFWVGGTGNWSDAANHWAATSGGAPGAGNLPTSLTDAMFNAASNATGYTVTLDAPVKNCLDLILGAPATGVFTIAGTSNVNVFGNFVVAAANVTPAATATLLFSATAGVKTITTNDVPVQFGFNFFGVGGTSQLAGDLYCNGNTFQVAGGTFDPNGKTVTLLTQQGAIAMAGNIPFYNLNLTNRAQKTDAITLAGNLTVANVFKYRGNSAVNRLLIQSSAIGTPRTITAAVVDAASDFVDFQDITGAGAAAPFATGTSLGDVRGNAGITFTPSAPQTGTGTASFTWSTHAWAGAPARVPLPQDDVLINNAFVIGRTITADMPRLGRNLTFTCTGNPIYSQPQQSALFGSLEMAAGMTTSGAQNLYFGARGGPVTLRSNGVTLAQSIRSGVVAGLNNTIQLLDALTCTNTIAIGATNGFNDGGFPVTAFTFAVLAATVSVAMNSTWTLSGTPTPFNNGSGCTIVAGPASVIKITDPTAAVKTFAGGGKTYRDFWYTGGGSLNVTGNNTFNQFRTDDFKTVAFTAGTTTTANDWQWGTDNTIGSITAASHTIVKTGTGIEYVVRANISRSNALPVGLWHAVYSTDGGNNTGWNFAIAAVLYSWPMMYVGNAGAPAGWVNTDAGDTTGTIPGYAGAPAWSDNPALCLRDFLINRAGLTTDDSYAASAAAWCDQLITGAAGTEKRCTMTLALTEKRPVRDWIETLRAYVPAWVVDAGGQWRIVADMPRAVDHFFGAGSIDSQPPPEITRTGTRDTPNAVDVSYTDMTKEPWQTYPATAELAADDVRRSNVSLPGIRRFSQAKRFAIERLNHYTLEDTVGSMSVFDYGLRVLPGDVAQVSEAAFGWAGRAVRILSVDDKGNGRWGIEFREYDPAAYSNEVQTAATIPETSLSSPLSTLGPTNVSAVEVLTAESNLPSVGIGTGIIFQSRVRLTFVESLDPYLSHYDVLIYNNPANPIVARVERGVERWLSPAVQQLTTYNVEVRAVNTLGIASPTVSLTLFIDGKQFPPGDVPAITQAFEVGGEVLLTWEPAADFDTLRYEWRVDLGNTGKVWDAMLLVDSVDGLRARFRGMPEGAHRFCVRALDSVGNYSVNSRCALITVTSDASAFMQDVEFSAPTLTNMVMLLTPFSMDETPSLRPRWATSTAATSWDATLPSPVDAGVLAVRAYGAGGAASSWRGEVQDVGTSVAGDFAITARLTSYVGSVRSFIEHSLDNIAWATEELTGGLSWRGEARFLRVLFQSNAPGDAFLIEGDPRISVSAAEGKESGGPVMSSATLATRINLVGRYGKATIINVTPLGSAPRTYTVDAVTVGAGVPNHFDVYLFNAVGAQIADNFMWNFSGV